MTSFQHTEHFTCCSWTQTKHSVCTAVTVGKLLLPTIKMKAGLVGVRQVKGLRCQISETVNEHINTESLSQYLYAIFHILYVSY